MEILQLAIGGAGVFGSRHVSQQGRLKKKKKKGGGFGRCWTLCGRGGTMNDAPVGGEESCLHLASPFFLYCTILSRTVPCCGSCWGGGRQLLYLAIVFRNGNGSYHNDTVLIWLGKYRKPVINPGPVCLCWFDSTISVLIWLPLCTTQMWYLCCFHAAQTGLQNKPAAVTLNPYKTVITCPS